MESDESNQVIKEISSQYFGGTIDDRMSELILRCFEQYDFTAEMCILLFKVGYEQDPMLSYLFLNSLAQNWNKEGFTKIEDIENYEEQQKRGISMLNKVEDLLKRSLNIEEYDQVIAWTEESAITNELISKAYEANIYRITKFSKSIGVNNITDTLKEWIRNNVSSEKEVDIYNNNEHRKRKWMYSCRNNGGVLWPTGGDIGIQSESNEGPPPPKSTDNDSDEIPDDVLSMFGNQNDE